MSLTGTCFETGGFSWKLKCQAVCFRSPGFTRTTAPLRLGEGLSCRARGARTSLRQIFQRAPRDERETPSGGWSQAWHTPHSSSGADAASWGSQGRIRGVLWGSGSCASSRTGGPRAGVPARAGSITRAGGAAPAAVPGGEQGSEAPALERPVRLSPGRGSGSLAEPGESWRGGQGEHSASVGAHNGVPVAVATREGIVRGPQRARAPRAGPSAAGEFQIHRQGHRREMIPFPRAGPVWRSGPEPAATRDEVCVCSCSGAQGDVYRCRHGKGTPAAGTLEPGPGSAFLSLAFSPLPLCFGTWGLSRHGRGPAPGQVRGQCRRF